MYVDVIIIHVVLHNASAKMILVILSFIKVIFYRINLIKKLY